MFHKEIVWYGWLRSYEIFPLNYDVFICQRNYNVEVLNQLGIENYHSICNLIILGQKISKYENGAKVDATLYKETVKSVMYLTSTRSHLILL